MAENNDLPEGGPDVPEAGLTPRARASRPAKRRSRAVRVAAEAPASATGARRRPHPVRSILTIAAVTGLVATAAIPAYAALAPQEATTTVQQLAEDGAQTLVVASDVQTSAMSRDSYTATTPAEIAKKQAAEAAEARARAAATTSYAIPAGVPLVAPGSGIVRRPLPYFNNFGAPYAGHRGTDYMVERGTPIYSIADGVVTASTDAGGGLGVTITIMHNINGHAVQSVYGHMLPGSRTVQVGQTVSVGQLIGQVSDTGLAYGTHLHLMIHVDGTRVDAEAWLVANAD